MSDTPETLARLRDDAFDSLVETQRRVLELVV